MATFVEAMKKDVETLCEAKEYRLAQEVLNMGGKGIGIQESGGVVRTGTQSIVCSTSGKAAHRVTAKTCDCDQYASHKVMADMGMVSAARCGHQLGHRIDSGSVSATALYELVQWAEDHAEALGLHDPSDKFMNKRTASATAVLEAIAAKAKRAAAVMLAAIKIQTRKNATIGGKDEILFLDDVGREKWVDVYRAAKKKYPAATSINSCKVSKAEAAQLKNVSVIL